MANVLVTGGAGYIGSHVLLPLIEHGHQPVVLDNFSRGHRTVSKIHPRIKVQEGDLSDQSQIEETLNRHKIDAVMHYAALAYVEESTRRPINYYSNNTIGTLNLAKALINYRIDSPPPIVFSSTCAVFGNPPDLPINEFCPKDPINPYGRSKLAGEWILQDLGRVHGLPSVILRYFNAAGADLTNKIGEIHEPETHLIPLAIRAARSQKEFTLHGKDYETIDGSAIRDFIHVKDLASAHIAALNYLLAGGASTDFNLGTGKGHSVLDVVHAVERITASKIRIKVEERREGDPPALVCESKKAKDVLKWSADHSSLDEIVADASSWDAHLYSFANDNHG